MMMDNSAGPAARGSSLSGGVGGHDLDPASDRNSKGFCFWQAKSRQIGFSGSSSKRSSPANVHLFLHVKGARALAVLHSGPLALGAEDCLMTSLRD
jgi:hypothetical protein